VRRASTEELEMKELKGAQSTMNRNEELVFVNNALWQLRRIVLDAVDGYAVSVGTEGIAIVRDADSTVQIDGHIVGAI
jgi:hypothetical protein